jgi:hypothetical protein
MRRTPACCWVSTSASVDRRRQQLSGTASHRLAQGVAPFVAEARAHGLPFLVTEFNSIACKGRRGVSDTFASALWGLDTLFELARVGVSGVDVHTRPDAAYAPFRLVRAHGRPIAHVAPLYDALRLFGQLTPAGTRVAPVRVASRFRVRAWSLTDEHGWRRRLRVVLIDEDPRARGEVRLQLAARGPADLLRLDAPSLTAKTAPTLAGQTYGLDARLHGRRRVERVGPDAGAGGYTVAFRRPGVAVITIPKA